MASSAKDFRRLETLTLPSGLQVDVRPLNLQRLVLTAPAGTLPDPITKRVMDSLIKGKKVNPKDQPEWTPDDVPKLNHLMEMVVKTVVVSPAIVDAPDYEQNQMAITDLQDAEINQIFAWAMPGVNAEIDAAITFQQ